MNGVLRSEALGVIARAEKALGAKLTEGQKVDLLLDNMPDIRDVAHAKAVLANLDGTRVKAVVHWMGGAPAKCDTCGTPIITVFYDMKTRQGPWGCLCPSCATLGPGINRTGTGFGQKYEKQADGKWLKTEG